MVLQLALVLGFNTNLIDLEYPGTMIGARIRVSDLNGTSHGGTFMSVLDSDCISAICDTDDISQLQFVAFDVETTGLSPVVARLVELSGVKFRLGDSDVTTFSTLIHPEMEIPPEVTMIHGITDAMVADAPKCADVIPQFLDWVGDSRTVLVAHNAPFDVEFLQVGMARLQRTRPSNFVLDTLPLARKALPESRDHKLKTLVEYLQLEEGGYHRALADSHHVRNVLLKIIEKIEAKVWSHLSNYDCVFNFDKELYDSAPPAELVQSIESINNAIAMGIPLTFVYSGYRSFRRIVDPVALIQSRGNYYLTAFCRKALAERTFRLDKISQLTAFEGGKSKARSAQAVS